MRHTTEQELDEIHAAITVYDFVDGQEVNRRPAFPMSGIRQSFREIAYLAARMKPKFDALAENIRKAGFDA